MWNLKQKKQKLKIIKKENRLVVTRGRAGSSGGRKEMGELICSLSFK